MQPSAQSTSAGARTILALALLVLSVVVVDAIFPTVTRALEPLTTTRIRVYVDAVDPSAAARAAESLAGDDVQIVCDPAPGSMQVSPRVKCIVEVRVGQAAAAAHNALMQIRAVDGLAAARATRPVNYVWGIAGAPLLVYSLAFFALALSLALALRWRPLDRADFRRLFSREAGLLIFLVCLPLNLQFLTSLVFSHWLPASWRSGYSEGIIVGTDALVAPSELPMYFAGNVPEVELPSILVSLVAVPVAEELVYRAILLRILLGWYAPWLAIGLSAAAFSAVHGFLWPEYTVQLFLGGLAYGWLWLRTRSLLLCVIAHALCNFIPVLKGFQAIDWSL